MGSPSGSQQQTHPGWLSPPGSQHTNVPLAWVGNTTDSSTGFDQFPDMEWAIPAVATILVSASRRSFLILFFSGESGSDSIRSFRCFSDLELMARDLRSRIRGCALLNSILGRWPVRVNQGARPGSIPREAAIYSFQPCPRGWRSKCITLTSLEEYDDEKPSETVQTAYKDGIFHCPGTCSMEKTDNQIRGVAGACAIHVRPG